MAYTYFASIAGLTVSSNSTTATGLILYNGSTTTVAIVNRIAVQVAVSSSSTTAIALAYGVQGTTPTGTTGLTSTGNLYFSGTASKLTAYSAATLAHAPTNIYPVLFNTAAIATTGQGFELQDISFEDTPIIIPPGYVLSLNAIGGATAANAVTAGIFWTEQPIAA